MSELSRIVSDHQLMAVSETEQDIVTQSDRNNAMKVPLYDERRNVDITLWSQKHRVKLPYFISLPLFVVTHTHAHTHIHTHPHKHTHTQNVESLLSNPAVRPEDCLRLGLLFSLRYEVQARGDLEKIDRMLTSRGLPEPERKVRV